MIWPEWSSSGKVASIWITAVHGQLPLWVSGGSCSKTQSQLLSGTVLVRSSKMFPRNKGILTHMISQHVLDCSFRSMVSKTPSTIKVVFIIDSTAVPNKTDLIRKLGWWNVQEKLLQEAMTRTVAEAMEKTSEASQKQIHQRCLDQLLDWCGDYSGYRKQEFYRKSVAPTSLKLFHHASTGFKKKQKLLWTFVACCPTCDNWGERQKEPVTSSSAVLHCYQTDLIHNASEAWNQGPRALETIRWVSFRMPNSPTNSNELLSGQRTSLQNFVAMRFDLYYTWGQDEIWRGSGRCASAGQDLDFQRSTTSCTVALQG